ncbi:hypothetical protein [Aquipuribacter hungaricus]|uniref:Uncharacterized protein n=1 Tax=Aquipuribacter hungaricus TaxID=545624 RepID=A0ABV7WJ17_9MICO
MTDDVDGMGDVDGTDDGDGDGAPRQGRGDGQQPGPLWRHGVRAAALALGIVLILQGLVGMVLGDGAEAGGAQPPVEASASFFDGIGGWPLAAAAVAFVVVARPWRLLGRQG